MGKLAEIAAEVERLGGKIVMPVTPDEIAENNIGLAMHHLQVARNEIKRNGASYHKADCLATARALLDEIEASAKPKKRRAA